MVEGQRVRLVGKTMSEGAIVSVNKDLGLAVVRFDVKDCAGRNFAAWRMCDIEPEPTTD